MIVEIWLKDFKADIQIGRYQKYQKRMALFI